MACVLVGIEIAVLASRWQVMRSWPSVVEAVDGAWLVLGILVVGCAAAVAVQPWQNREMTASLPDSGARTVAATGVVVGLVAAGVHLIAVAGVLAWGWAAHLPGLPRLWPILGVLVGLWACAMFGTAVARLDAGWLSPLLAMGLYVVALFVIRALGGNGLVELGGVSVVLVGLVPDTGAMLWRAAWLAAIGCVAWGVAAYGQQALRRVSFWILTVATIGLTVTAASESDKEFVSAPVEWVCTQGPPKVCVAAEYDDRLDDYAAAITVMAPSAKRVGLPEPTDGYRQTVGVRPGPGSFNVDARVNGEQLAFDLVQFSLPCSVRWGEHQLQQADTVAGWIATQSGWPLPPGIRTPDLRSAQHALVALECGQ